MMTPKKIWITLKKLVYRTINKRHVKFCIVYREDPAKCTYVDNCICKKSKCDILRNYKELKQNNK